MCRAEGEEEGKEAGRGREGVMKERGDDEMMMERENRKSSLRLINGFERRALNEFVMRLSPNAEHMYIPVHVCAIVTTR